MPRPVRAAWLPRFRSSSNRSRSFSSCFSFGTNVRSLAASGFNTAVVVAFTKVESVREWSGDPELETLESLGLASKHPPLERGDHRSEGTGMKFVSVWNDSRASVGDMSDGEAGVGEA